MAIRGSLREASLPDVLQLLAMGKKTGCLSVTHRDNFGYVYFDRGRIAYASIVNRRDRLGELLIQAGLLTREQLDVGIETQQDHPDRRLGEILIGLGYVTREALHDQVRTQIEEAVYFLFTWSHGTFSFEPDVRPDEHGFRGVDQSRIAPPRGGEARRRMGSHRKEDPELRPRVSRRPRAPPRKRSHLDADSAHDREPARWRTRCACPHRRNGTQ